MRFYRFFTQLFSYALPIILLPTLLASCATYKKPTESFATDNPREIIASKHWLYAVIPRHRSQIRLYDLGHWSTWALFGNDDDGLFGEGQNARFRLDDPVAGRLALRWGIRNPLHNFTFYVIGQAYYKNSEFALASLSKDNCRAFQYNENAKTVFAKEGSSFFLGLHGWKPFIALRFKYSQKRRGDFYLGWRERGNFGLKLTPFSSCT